MTAPPALTHPKPGRTLARADARAIRVPGVWRASVS